MNFKQINQARETLGLKEYATLEEIKKTYRNLAHKYHPDKCKNKDKERCEEMFKKVTHANDILMDYCAGYNYSFKEKDVKKNTMSKEYYQHLKRFYDGWWFKLDF